MTRGLSNRIGTAHYAGQRAREWATWALRSALQLAHLMVLPAALLCLWHALQSLPPNELRTLLGRDVSLSLPGDRIPFITGIPASLAWPVTFLGDMATYATGKSGQWSMVARDAALGLALLIAANVLGYFYQDRRAILARIGVVAWALLVGLTLYDLYAYAEIVAFWRFPKGGAWPPGAYLRLAEMACLGTLIGALSTIIYNRSRLDLFQPLSHILFPVWFGLTWRGAVVAYAAPWLLGVLDTIRGQYLRHPGDWTDTLIGYSAIGLILLLVWIVIVRGALSKLADVARIIHLMILMRGPLPHDTIPSGAAPYAPSQGRVGWP